MRHQAILLVASLAALSACASDPDRVPSSQRTWVPQGEPVSCITTRNIRSIHVVDDQTINFVMSSTRMFRNDLPNRCPGLAFNRAIKHNSRTSQLCNVDTFTVIQGGGMPRGATCGFGRFQPMVPADTLAPVPASTPVPPAK
jgi:hypothetical protein